MDGGELFPEARTREVLAPGAVFVPDWLDLDTQLALVEACERWAQPPAPLRATRTPGGGVMSVETVCLGWHWTPYRYTRRAIDTDGSVVEPVPSWLADLGRRAVADAYADGGGDPAAANGYDPDAVLINRYDRTARMGLHQDKDERSDLPVVSISLGAACTFRFGNAEHRGRPWRDIELRSGDLVVFGGPSRLAFHGVPKVLPGPSDPAFGPPGTRWNLTLRVTGLVDDEPPSGILP